MTGSWNLLNLSNPVSARALRARSLHSPPQEQRIAIGPGAELTAQLWFIFAAQRAADPVLEAMRAVLRDVWRHEEPAAA
jgi:hypothetical protein